MDTDTREEFFERFTEKQTYEVNDEGGHYDAYYADWVGTPIEVWDFIEQKLKQARMEELEFVVRGLYAPYNFTYLFKRLSELKGEQL